MARNSVPPEPDDRGPEHQTLMPAVGDVLHRCLHSAVQHVFFFVFCISIVSLHVHASLVAIEHRWCSKYIAAF
jgi:hypothetical protein